MMWFIPKNKKVIFPLTAGLFLSFGFMTGCKESAPPANKPAVVKKRIEQTPRTKVTETEKTAPPAETETPKTEEAAVPDAKTTLAQAPEAAREKSAAPQPETETDPTETAAVPETQTGEGTPGETAEETEPESLKASLLDNTFPKYDPTGKIDPFATLFSKESEAESDDSQSKRPKTPLEKIDISQLKLGAIIQAESGNMALVKDAGGKPYFLTPGTYVGIHSGTVTEILADRVVIEEKTKDVLGRQNAKTRELKLQKPLGEE